MNIFERFYSKVTKTDTCWIWNASTRQGYGAFKIAGQVESAHRVSYVLATGKIIDENNVILHSCDNRLCVNPAHLSEGTQKDNVIDAIAKNRLYDISVHSGSRFKPGHKAKLTLKDKQEILKLVKDGKLSYREIGAMFGVDHTRVYQIKKGLYI